MSQPAEPEDFRFLLRLEEAKPLHPCAETLLWRAREAVDRVDSPTHAETGIIVQCAWCKRFKVANEWMNFALPPGPGISHGICEDCLVRVQPEPPGAEAQRPPR